MKLRIMTDGTYLEVTDVGEEIGESLSPTSILLKLASISVEVPSYSDKVPVDTVEIPLKVLLDAYRTVKLNERDRGRR